VQTENMPGWLEAFANHQPMTQVIDAVRAFLLDQRVGTHGWQALAWCLGILLVFIRSPSPSTGASPHVSVPSAAVLRPTI